MANNEVNAVPAANDTTSSGPLAVSETNPRYFTVAVGGVFDRIARQQRRPRDRQRLLRFLDGYAATMPRTMLRNAIEHLDGEQRAHYLSLKQATEAGQDQGENRS
jgi:hypothetical protein